MDYAEIDRPKVIRKRYILTMQIGCDEMDAMVRKRVPKDVEVFALCRPISQLTRDQKSDLFAEILDLLDYVCSDLFSFDIRHICKRKDGAVSKRASSIAGFCQRLSHGTVRI